MVIMFLLTGQERLVNFAPILNGNNMHNYQQIAKDIDSNVEMNEKVLLIGDNDNSYCAYLNYYCDNAVVASEPINQDNIDEIRNKYDYVYIINTYDTSLEMMKALFNDSNNIINQRLYSLEVDL